MKYKKRAKIAKALAIAICIFMVLGALLPVIL